MYTDNKCEWNSAEKSLPPYHSQPARDSLLALVAITMPLLTPKMSLRGSARTQTTIIGGEGDAPQDLLGAAARALATGARTQPATSGSADRIRELEQLVEQLISERDAARSELEAARAVILENAQDSAQRRAAAAQRFNPEVLCAALATTLFGPREEEQQMSGNVVDETLPPAAAPSAGKRANDTEAAPSPATQLGASASAVDTAAAATTTSSTSTKSSLQQGHTPVDSSVASVFARFDADGNGHLDEEELGDALRALNLNVTDAQAKLVLGMYDDDKNGTLEMQEFARLVNHFLKFTELSPETSDRELLRRRSFLAGGGPTAPAAIPQVMSLDTFIATGKTGFEELEGTLDKETMAVVDFLQAIGVTKNQTRGAGVPGALPPQAST